jgi:hypothetical protein
MLADFKPGSDPDPDLLEIGARLLDGGRHRET